MAVARTAPDQRSDPTPPAVPRRGRSFRADIEGLRAIAVVAVLLYHASVPHAAGGFVGVDVFFVISGFLITGTLVNELLRTGRLSFTGFYAARARRILPASALVLVFVAVSGLLLLQPLRVVGVETDVRDAAVYLVNWHFVAQQTSYMHVGAAPSPVLNFWSLSVEEQFYLLWPLLLVCAVWAARRFHASRVAAIAIVLALVAAVSFFLSYRWTSSDASLAYLSSPSRAWEFALGGAVALCVPVLRRLGTGRGVLIARSSVGVLGLAAIVWSCIAYNNDTAFPGVAALVPTFGTALIIMAGTGSWARIESASERSSAGGGAHSSVDAADRGVGWLFGFRPVRWIGRLSYSLYLWHWPLLIIVEGRTGPLTWPWQLLVVTGSVVPAVLTMWLVEQPLRFSAVVRSSASCGLALGVTATCFALVSSLLVGSHVLREVGGQGNSVAAAATLNVQLADASLAAEPFGTSDSGGGPVQPDLLHAAADVADFPPACTVSATATTSPPCVVGDAQATGRVVLLGDGTAGQWFPAVQAVARDHDWSVEVLAKDGCPVTAIDGPVPPGPAGTSCATWSQHILSRLHSGPRPKLVFLASASTPADATTFGRATAALARLGAPLVYLRAAPKPRADFLDCLSTSLSHWASCAEPRTTALPADALADAVTDGRAPHVHLVDLAAELCPGTTEPCPAVGDGVLLYRSGDSLTATAAADLGPTLEADLETDGLVTLHVGPTGAPRSGGPTLPSPLQAPDDWPADTSRCLIGVKPTSTAPCYYGDLTSKTTVLLLGDSHALEWIPTFSVIARQQGWRLEVYAKESCPAPLLYTYAPGTTQDYTECTAWRANTLAAVARGPRPAMIILGTLNRYTQDPGQLVAGWKNTLDKLEALHAPIIYLRDTPFSQNNVPTCLSASLDDWGHCSFSEASAVRPDPVATKLQHGWFPNVRVIDIDSLLCPAGTCLAAIDGIDLYIDQSHMTAVFSAALAPVMANELDAAEASLRLNLSAVASATDP